MQNKARSVPLLLIVVMNCFGELNGAKIERISKNGVLYFNVVPRNGIYEIDMHDFVPNVNSVYNVSNKRVKHNLDSTYLWHCRLAHINKKHEKETFPYSTDKGKDFLEYTSDVMWFHLGHVSKDKSRGCEGSCERDTPDKIEQDLLCMLNSLRKVHKSRNHVVRAVDLDSKFKRRRYNTYEISSKNSSRGDLNEPTSYKATMLDSKSNKWIDAMNAEIQSMMDNMVWVLVDLPPGCFVDPNHPRKVMKFKDPFMVFKKHQEAGIKDLIMRKIKAQKLRVDAIAMLDSRLIEMTLSSKDQDMFSF
ncbi:hypothetical protein Tco_0167612 [Tanacetum coccineum]